MLENGSSFLRPGFKAGGAVVVRNLDGCGALGLEAQVNIEDVEEAAQQQARTDKEHASQGNLSHNENGAEPFVLAALS